CLLATLFTGGNMPVAFLHICLLIRQTEGELSIVVDNKRSAHARPGTAPFILRRTRCQPCTFGASPTSSNCTALPRLGTAWPVGFPSGYANGTPPGGGTTD